MKVIILAALLASIATAKTYYNSYDSGSYNYNTYDDPCKNMVCEFCCMNG